MCYKFVAWKIGTVHKKWEKIMIKGKQLSYIVGDIG